MKKWYRSSIVKGALILLAILMAAGSLISMYEVVTFMPAGNVEELLGQYERDYFETADFENNFLVASRTILDSLRNRENFETEGVFDDQKIVDIQGYWDTHSISGENLDGFAYRLSDLQNWSEDYNRNGIEMGDPIVVCLKPDETYQYYRMSEFEQLMLDRKLILEDIGNITGFIQELKDGYYSDGTDVALLDENGNIVYKDCWTYKQIWTEPYAPIGYNSMIDIANSDPKWNGRLSEMYKMMTYTLEQISYDLSNYTLKDDAYHEGNTNYTYLLVDLNAGTIKTNRSKWTEFEDYELYIKEIQSGNDKYCVIREYLKDCDSNLKHFMASNWQSTVAYGVGSQKMSGIIFAASVDSDLPIADGFQSVKMFYEESLKYQPMASIIMWTGLALMFASVIVLVIICGRRMEDEEVHLNIFDSIPTEIAAAGVLVLWFFPALGFAKTSGSGLSSVWNDSAYGFMYVTDYGRSSENFLFAGLLGAWTCGMFLLGLLSLVRRIKAKTLWKNSVLRKVWILLKQVWDHRSAAFRTLVICGAFCVLHWMAMLIHSYNISAIHALAVAAELAAVLWLLQNAVSKDRVCKGLKEISEGALDYEISTAGMQKDYANMAEQINHIGDGLQNAVEASMKNERMKTELITNVSHDIKTPLTSIINYVDLLKRENFEDPKIQNYLDILDQKSQRLKQLTEDVVEASKASAGNITLNCMNLDLVEMIHQAEGEFEEKFAAKNLQSVLRLPEEPAVIYADGRRVWRILENVYNNAAKYAMPGTRVYADLEMNEKEITFSLKNISEQPLNISADELTERFIRGDVSRSTEGSGLGLSIARSLTELQDGTFKLYLDGDLFRVTITFPRVK